MKKVLLDEHLPHLLRHKLPGHDVYTAAYMGWDSLRNGLLMAAAEGAGFDVILTMDVGFRHQRPGTARKIAIVFISAPSNRIDDLLPFLAQIDSAIDQASAGSITEVP